MLIRQTTKADLPAIVGLLADDESGRCWSSSVSKGSRTGEKPTDGQLNQASNRLKLQASVDAHRAERAMHELNDVPPFLDGTQNPHNEWVIDSNQNGGSWATYEELVAEGERIDAELACWGEDHGSPTGSTSWKASRGGSTSRSAGSPATWRSRQPGTGQRGPGSAAADRRRPAHAWRCNVEFCLNKSSIAQE